MALPSPTDAANARYNAGPLNLLGSSLLRQSPIYNMLGSLTHIINGTTGQYGNPPPSIFNKLASLFSGNPTNAPAATAVNSDPNQGGYYEQGAGFTPYSPSGQPQAGNPQPGTATTPGQTPTGIGAGGIPQSIWQQVYGSGRFTNAPAFSPTVAQTLFQSSAVGSPGDSISNPYTGVQGPDSAPDNSVPGWSQALMSYIKSRTQL